MPSDHSSTNATMHCPQCGTVVPAGSRICWLCFAAIDSKSAQPTSKPANLRAATAAFDSAPLSENSFSLASLMMLVTLICVVLGVTSIAPGIGIPLGILFIIVWLRTAAVTRRRAARGLDVTPTEKVQLFAASFGVTASLFTLIAVAGFAAFLAACFTCMGTFFGLASFTDESVALTVAWFAFGVVTLVILFIGLRYVLPSIIKFVRRRWRRDIGEE